MNYTSTKKNNLQAQIESSNKSITKIFMIVSVSFIFGMIYSATSTANSYINSIQTVQQMQDL